MRTGVFIRIEYSDLISVMLIPEQILALRQFAVYHDE